jgi:FtsP/CotA-like multicopper oxidase with cupredoxin domain
MFQNGTNWMDGTTGVTQCPVPPGRSFLYNFTIDQQFGTYWWHAHASTQYIDGIAGPLIVHAPEEAATRQNYDFDRVIVVSDFYHQLSSTLLPGYFSSGNENAEPVPDNGFIQGQNYFNCSSYGSDSGYDCTQNSSRSVFSFKDNKRYRLRFINTGAFTTFQVSIDNHSLEIIEADGTLVEPLPIHRFEIATAQRYSVILATNQSKSTNYWIRAQMNTDCFAADNTVLDTTVLALLTYENTTAAPTQSNDWADALDLVCKDLNNTLLSPTTVQQAPPADVIYETQFAFNIGAYALSLGYMNGTSWKPNEANPTLNQAISGLKTTNASSFAAAGVVSSVFSQNQFIISIPTAKVVDLVIMNFDDGSHPFHLHGHVFWVMATSAEQYFPWDTDLYSQMNSTASNIYTKNPMRRDTVTIGAYSWALIRFENTVPGMWALHCHNIWHMEAGLMMQFLSLESVVKTWVLPDDVAGLCKA